MNIVFGKLLDGKTIHIVDIGCVKSRRCHELQDGVAELMPDGVKFGGLLLHGEVCSNCNALIRRELENENGLPTRSNEGVSTGG